ncbi:glucan biosynthesis protein [Rhodophyticola sp.]|jgi:glucans biosynthesis protein|uniref:glucan biosynthesis protein n=1 Tax=Rhodophyticola sp. TaxID=2680032 RepID=UPI003D2A361F
MTLHRRTFLSVLAAAASLPRTLRAELITGEHPFSPDWLWAEAEALAARPYRPVLEVSAPWRDLSYDQYRMIWFNSQRGIWTGTDRPLHLDLFAAGLYFPRPVEINLVEDGVAQTLGFDIGLFDRTDQFPDLPVDETMGYSGLRLRAELNTPGIFEEFMVFQGASYFRAIANGQTYGLSARGLALGTGDAEGEEFPDFTRFWVEAPAPGSDTYMVHALLDGPSTTGAYSFSIRAGRPTTVEVRATVFPRRDLDHVGLAPLTSMFLFDETNHIRFDDFRPAVHDSDGLLIWNGAGERLWRPLANPRTLQISHFVDDGPRGFGLMQRAREVEDFADFEARYENRPSLWITPAADWGAGSVQLVEIPADREIYDNIVAFWRPRDVIPAGTAHDFAYRMSWGDTPGALPDVAAVTNTRIGGAFDQIRKVVAVDFEDHPLLRGDPSDYTHHISASALTLSDGVLERNPGTGGLRLAFSFDPAEAETSELRAQLRRDGVLVSEVWLYRWTA